MGYETFKVQIRYFLKNLQSQRDVKDSSSEVVQNRDVVEVPRVFGEHAKACDLSTF
jgi:hypothetical protein